MAASLIIETMLLIILLSNLCNLSLMLQKLELSIEIKIYYYYYLYLIFIYLTFLSYLKDMVLWTKMTNL